MGLDIRIPLGMIFAITGAILALYGLITRHSAIYQASLGINLNLWWGALMFLFGATMWFVGRRQKWQNDPVTQRPWERQSGPKQRR